MNDIKQQILDEIKNNTMVFIKVSNIQFRIRCPICGDSQTNPRDAHCYIKCDFNNPTEPLLFNCFKCNKSGKINSDFLKRLNIKSNIIQKIDNQRFNKIGSIEHTKVDIITGNPLMNSLQVKYIEDRLGKGFSYDDYDKFKIIWDMSTVYPYITSIRTRNSMPSNNDSISFLSDDKSVLLVRAFNNNGDRWRKLTLFQSPNKSFYTIKTTLDLFTKDEIIVNIAEGIMDVLSIYKNFNDNNSVYIASLGSDYIGAIDYAISKGFIGSNIIIKIYIDNDINETILIPQLSKFKWLFKSIYVYKNILSKDMGVKIDKISLIEQKVRR